MAFLKKNKDDFEEEEKLSKKGSYQKRLIKDERRSSGYTSKEFKDLKPKNRRKRKEPKKPWGKFERYLVIAVILLTAGTSGILALSARSWKLPGLPRLTFPHISIPGFLSEETIIIEGRKEDEEKARRVMNAFGEKTENLSGVWGLYVVRLDNGYSYGVNENETFQAASLVKLPVMAGMYVESEAGDLDLNGKYTLKSQDKISGSGSLYGKPAGYEITYGNLVNLMGKQSDNTAFNVARTYLGEEKIAEAMAKIGMIDTNLTENETTLKDIGNFFEELWNGNVLKNENKDKLLASLTDTIYENWLADGIPDSVQVAHKFGREVHVVNDAGIVFADNPYVVVILTKGVVERDADRIFPDLSRTVYEIETD